MALHDAFLAGAAAHADRTALEVDGRSYPYAELADDARRWAGALLDRLAVVERVGLLARRSHPGYAGTLAALLAGAAFVPLSPALPPARLREMAARAMLDAVVVDGRGAEVLARIAPALAPDVLVLAPGCDGAPPGLGRAVTSRELARAPALDRAPTAPPQALAYLMFTSGTTGGPKGVPITHGNVDHFLTVAAPRHAIGPDDRASQLFEQTFDLSVADLFLTWAGGGIVCVPSPAEARDPVEFAERRGLTVWFSVPSVVTLAGRAGALRDGRLPRLRASLFCGEALPVAVAERWRRVAPASTIDNLYGPTELTIACTAHRWDQAGDGGGHVPIGEVHAGLDHVVIDDRGEPVAGDGAGELCVAGPQRFGGYWGDAATSRRHWWSRPGGPAFYRTGDLVGRRGSAYAYRGRVDDQVKLHGHRIEPGEVEAALLAQPGVHQAAVVVGPAEDGTDGLVAFVSGGDADPARRVAALRSVLPPYLVPHEVVPLDALPLNANGKTDRAALRSRLAQRRASRG